MSLGEAEKAKTLCNILFWREKERLSKEEEK